MTALLKAFLFLSGVAHILSFQPVPHGRVQTKLTDMQYPTQPYIVPNPVAPPIPNPAPAKSLPESIPSHLSKWAPQANRYIYTGTTGGNDVHFDGREVCMSERPFGD